MFSEAGGSGGSGGFEDTSGGGNAIERDLVAEGVIEGEIGDDVGEVEEVVDVDEDSLTCRERGEEEEWERILGERIDLHKNREWPGIISVRDNS